MTIELDPIESARSSDALPAATGSESAVWTPVLDLPAPGEDGLHSVEAWKERVESLLTDQPCVFRRNQQITALYAAAYLRHPQLFKWAGMAASASHHVRIALWPLRLGADADGRVDLPRMLGRWSHLHLDDIDRVRRTNNAIFDDVFWIHLAYDGDPARLERLRPLLEGDARYAELLAAFDRIEAGRCVVGGGDDEVWRGNLEILEHEQRALVQPRFNELSGAFARAFSAGATLGFRARGLRRAASVFTSFFGHSLTRRTGVFVRERRLPQLTRFEDRWHWVERSIVPRYRRFEAASQDIRASLGEMVLEATTGSDTGRCALTGRPLARG